MANSMLTKGSIAKKPVKAFKLHKPGPDMPKALHMAKSAAKSQGVPFKKMAKAAARMKT